MLVIFVALKCCAPLTHRELIDLVVLVQEARIITQIEDVSKTKIRAVFCMLKNSRAMITAEGEGESVKIHFGKGISTFRQFRERQDSFINKCCTLQQIFIPHEMKGDLIWQLDPTTMRLRIEELRRLEVFIEEYISGQILNSNGHRLVSHFHHRYPSNRNSRVYQVQTSLISRPIAQLYSADNFQRHHPSESSSLHYDSTEHSPHYGFAGYPSNSGTSFGLPLDNISFRENSFASLPPQMPEPIVSHKANIFRREFQSTSLSASLYWDNSQKERYWEITVLG
jgi:hypothetical protein